MVCFRLLRPLADKLFVVQINSHWPYLLEYARGEPSCWDRCIEAGAQRLVEIAKANAADEIVVVGHSGGGVTAPALVVRALELDPDLGRHGPRVVLLTPGSLMPGIGLHRDATRVHRDIARIAVEPSILWIDVQARADMLNFYNFDPVGGIGIDAGPRALQSVRLDGAVARHAGAGVLQQAAPAAGFACTISSSWRTTCARLTNT